MRLDFNQLIIIIIKLYLGITDDVLTLIITKSETLNFNANCSSSPNEQRQL